MDIELPDGLIDMEKHLNTWDDTAGLIQNLDLVISSCTSVAHLSAAMNKQTWVIIPTLPYYIWAHGSDYYKSVTLFQQGRNQVWDETFQEIDRCLDDK